MTHATTVLTPREREIAALLGTGKANKEIARDLGISPQTVKNHLVAIYQALGMANRAQVSAWWAVATMGEE